MQLKRLKSTVDRVYTNVSFYRKKLDSIGIKPEDIKTLADLAELPFTSKQDMRDSYPYSLFAEPMNDIVRLHVSSGTTGKPTVVGYTKDDIVNWSNLMARCLVAAGVDKRDIIQNAYGYGLFTGGLGVHGGAEILGASVIPVSGGNTARQLTLMQDFGSTILACTPSYSLHIAEEAATAGIELRSLKLRLGIFGAEPWTEAMRYEIENRLNITALDIYGLSEIMGPGVAQECFIGVEGLHIWEDHFLPEIIDPVTGHTLPEGVNGELVITTITKQGIPLIRYRTRDVTSLNYEQCVCGRTHARIARLSGRTDDMLTIRGVNVFPSQVESVLLGIDGVSPNYMLVIECKRNLDVLEVHVETNERSLFINRALSNRLITIIEKELKSVLGISCAVILKEPKTIKRSEGKVIRVIDNRYL